MNFKEIILETLLDLSSGAKAVELVTNITSTLRTSIDLNEFELVMGELVKEGLVGEIEYTHEPLNRLKSFYWLRSDDDVIRTKPRLS